MATPMEGAMEIIETTLTPHTVRLRFADSTDPGEATEWLDILVKSPIDPTLPLTAIRANALLRARNIIDDEIERLRSLASLRP